MFLSASSRTISSFFTPLNLVPIRLAFSVETTSSPAPWAMSDVRRSSSNSSSMESSLELAVITRPPVLVAVSPKSTSIFAGPLETSLRPVVDCIGSFTGLGSFGCSGFFACSTEAALFSCFLCLRSVGTAANGSGVESSSSSHSSSGSSVVS